MNFEVYHQTITILLNRLETRVRKIEETVGLADGGLPSDLPTLKETEYEGTSLQREVILLREHIDTFDQWLAHKTSPADGASPSSLPALWDITQRIASVQEEQARCRKRLDTIEQRLLLDVIPLSRPHEAQHAYETVSSEIFSQLLQRIFMDDAQVKQAAHTLLNTFLTERTLNAEDLSIIRKMVQQRHCSKDSGSWISPACLV